jgi:hypothetical protein
MKDPKRKKIYINWPCNFKVEIVGKIWIKITDITCPKSK